MFQILATYGILATIVAGIKVMYQGTKAKSITCK